MKCWIGSLAALLALVIFATCVTESWDASAAERPVISRYRENQKRARDLTADLLSVVLDSHIQQLEDNGLTDLPLYHDLTAMRGRLNALAAEMMPQVLELLVAADTAQGSRRNEILGDVQAQMRQILLRLLAERERLRLRRQQAELIERLSEVITKQGETRNATLELRNAKEDAVIAAVNDQKNVRALYGAFAEVLDDVATWPGELGATASSAHRLLTSAGIDPILDDVERLLKSSRYDEAAQRQQKVLQVLQHVHREMRMLEDPQGIDENVAAAVQEILNAQNKLRENIAQGALTDDIADSAAKDQLAIQRKVQQLQNIVGNNERAKEWVRIADSSAAKARQALFSKQKSGALRDQGHVLGALGELQKELQNSPAGTKQLSAAEHLNQAKRLAAVRQWLDRSLNNHAQAAAAASTPQATALRRQNATTLGKLAAVKNLPETVTSAIQSAADAAAKSAKTNPDATPQSTKAQRDTDRAIRLALGTTAEAERKARRSTLATQLGELNRAVEALARAAGTARNIAEQTKPGRRMDAPAAADAEKQVRKIQDLAKNVAAGVQHTAPNAVDELTRAAAHGERVTAALPETGQGNPAAAQQATLHARQMATQLDDAANQLRDAMTTAAQQLLATTGKELSDLTKVEDRVRQAYQKPPPASQLQNLADQVLKHTPSVGAAMQQAAKAAREAQNKPAQGTPTEPGQNPPRQGTPQSGNPPNANPPNGSPSTNPQTGDAPKDQDARRQLLRAEVLAAMKRRELQRDHQLAQSLAKHAQMGHQSAAQIAAAREAMTAKQPSGTPTQPSQGGQPHEPRAGDAAKPPASANPKASASQSPPASSPAQGAAEQQARRDLANAMNKQATSLATVGEAAAQMLGQSELANEQIAKAAQIAASLAPRPPGLQTALNLMQIRNKREQANATARQDRIVRAPGSNKEANRKAQKHKVESRKAPNRKAASRRAKKRRAGNRKEEKHKQANHKEASRKAASRRAKKRRAKKRRAGNRKAEKHKQANHKEVSRKEASRRAKKRRAGNRKAEKHKQANHKEVSRKAASRKAKKRRAGNRKAEKHKQANHKEVSRKEASRKAKKRRAGNRKAEKHKQANHKEVSRKEASRKEKKHRAGNRKAENHKQVSRKEASRKEKKHRAGNRKAEKHKQANHKEVSRKAASRRAKKRRAGNRKAEKRKQANHKEVSRKEASRKAKKHRAENRKAANHKQANHKQANHKQANHKQANHKQANHKPVSRKEASRKAKRRRAGNRKAENHKVANHKEVSRKEASRRAKKHQAKKRRAGNRKAENHKVANRKVEMHKEANHKVVNPKVVNPKVVNPKVVNPKVENHKV